MTHPMKHITINVLIYFLFDTQYLLVLLRSSASVTLYMRSIKFHMHIYNIAADNPPYYWGRKP